MLNVLCFIFAFVKYFGMFVRQIASLHEYVCRVGIMVSIANMLKFKDDYIKERDITS